MTHHYGLSTSHDANIDLSTHPLHFGFLMFEGNDIFHSAHGTALLSTSIHHRPNRYKGLGEYLNTYNYRHSIAYFCSRSLCKNKWMYSNDVFIGR